MIKLDGKIINKCQLVLDFCTFNYHTVDDAYPMPDGNETLAHLMGANYYACLDVKSAFWRLVLTERASEYSTVVTLDG